MTFLKLLVLCACSCLVLLCADSAAAVATATAAAASLSNECSAGAAVPRVTLAVSGNLLSLSNGFVQFGFDLRTATSTLAADFTGGAASGHSTSSTEYEHSRSDVHATSISVAPGVDASPLASAAAAAATVGANVLGNIAAGTGSLAIEVQDQLLRTASTAGWMRASLLPYAVNQQSDDYVSVTVSSITDSATKASTESSFTFGLRRGSRSLEFNATVELQATVNATAVKLAMYFTPRSMYALFDDGVVQTMNSPQPFFGTASTLRRFYALDAEAGAIDVTPVDIDDTAQVVLYNSLWNRQFSGLQLVLAGGKLAPVEAWLDGWENSKAAAVGKGSKFTTALLLAPNNLPFPSSAVPTCGAALPVADLTAVMSAVYGSPAGALVSHKFAPEGRITPCIGTPGRCYGGLYNFFDPDSFLSISAMMYAGDAYLNNEVRKLLETNEHFMCATAEPGVCSAGQLPHHFIPACGKGVKGCKCEQWGPRKDCVTYYAISGATQTGPNIFWSLAALKYASVSGNVTWLKQRMPHLRLALSFLLNSYNKEYNLLSVPGSLWVDTLRRRNLTTDSNAGMVYLLTRLATAEEFVGNSSGAATLTGIANRIKLAMNKYLWNAQENDHYVSYALLPVPPAVNLTQRDFVDYDSNLLAVMAGVPDTATRASAILGRIDAGVCSHARPTWISEIYYNASNCHLNNTGDSAVSMGRIAWADGRARLAVGGPAAAQAAQDLIIDPIQGDQLENVWMYERYQCGAKPTHNPFYIEYPEAVAMLLFEVKYGLDIAPGKVIVNPLLSQDFTWRVGNLMVAYNTSSVAVTLPYTVSNYSFTFHGVQAGTWQVSQSSLSGVQQQATMVQSVHVGSSGILQFAATTTGAFDTVSAVLQTAGHASH